MEAGGEQAGLQSDATQLGDPTSAPRRRARRARQIGLRLPGTASRREMVNANITRISRRRARRRTGNLEVLSRNSLVIKIEHTRPAGERRGLSRRKWRECSGAARRERGCERSQGRPRNREARAGYCS